MSELGAFRILIRKVIFSVLSTGSCCPRNCLPLHLWRQFPVGGIKKCRQDPTSLMGKRRLQKYISKCKFSERQKSTDGALHSHFQHPRPCWRLLTPETKPKTVDFWITVTIFFWVRHLWGLHWWCMGNTEWGWCGIESDAVVYCGQALFF